LTDDLSFSFISTIIIKALAYFNSSKIIFGGHLLINQTDDQKLYILALIQIRRNQLKNICRVTVDFVPQ
jgi:hypothetical protein